MSKSILYNNTFVFICGLHKSGTSLLHRLLRTHSKISGFSNTGVPQDEGQHLQDIIPQAFKFGGPGKFGFNPNAYLDETSALATQANALKIIQQWENHLNIDKPYIIEKSPPNLIRTRLLQKLFPNAIFIVLTRHPIPVSVATSKWSRTSMNSLLEHWLLCHEKFDEDKNYLNNYIQMKYEDLAQNPKETLSRITSRLSIEPIILKEIIKSHINKKYMLRWNIIHNIPILKLYTTHLISKYENRVNAFGYTLKNLNGDGTL